MDEKTKLAILSTYCVGLIIAMIIVRPTSQVWLALIFSLLVLIAISLCEIVMLREVKNGEYGWTAILSFFSILFFAVVLPDFTTATNINIIYILGIILSALAGLTILYALIRFAMEYFHR